MKNLLIAVLFAFAFLVFAEAFATRVVQPAAAQFVNAVTNAVEHAGEDRAGRVR